jgi:hypothetical protein
VGKNPTRAGASETGARNSCLLKISSVQAFYRRGFGTVILVVPYGEEWSICALTLLLSSSVIVVQRAFVLLRLTGCIQLGSC